MAEEVKEAPKKVWIRCRANERCEGNEAVIVWETKQKPATMAGGTFIVAERAGKMIRYRCCTCQGVFHIGQ